MEHPDWPNGLGIVIKVAHGWNSQATWYVSRAVLGVLGIQLRNPYPLHRQKAFIVPGIVPDKYREALEEVVTWSNQLVSLFESAPFFPKVIIFFPVLFGRS